MCSLHLQKVFSVECVLASELDIRRGPEITMREARILSKVRALVYLFFKKYSS